MMLHTKYQDSRPYGFRQGGGVGPRAIIWVEVHQVMLHTKTLGHIVSDKKIFSCFSLYKPM